MNEKQGQEITNKTIANLDDDQDFNNVLKVILKRKGFSSFRPPNLSSLPSW